MSASEKHPCPACSSSDAYAIYDDGHGHCFSCDYHLSTDNQETHMPTPPSTFKGLVGEIEALPTRKLSKAVCEKYRYQVGEWKEQKVHIAPFYSEGKMVGQKLRFKDKKFMCLGEAAGGGFFGQHLWNDGRWVVVTEGELDAMSICQVFGLSWPAVSLPNGAAGSEEIFKRNVEWLEKFEQVKICFDNDQPGRDAAQKCAQILSPGRAQIITLPLKDASDMLQAGRVKELTSAVFSAATWRPDGIVPGDTLWKYLVDEESIPAIPLPWEGLQRKTGGLRKGELWTLCAGTGVGKTQVARELIYHLLTVTEVKIGIISLEESLKESCFGLMSLHANLPHWDTEKLSEEELRPSYDATVGSGRIYLYDHFGSFDDTANLMNRIRYMAKALKTDWIVFDHITIALSGAQDEKSGGERKAIDVLMTSLRSLVSELGIGMIVISHLSRQPGRSAEEGGQVGLHALRGSHSIAQLSNMVIALERNLQGDDDDTNTTTLRVLKNRYNGRTGRAGILVWDDETGRLNEGTTEDERGAFSNEPAPF